MASKSLTFNIFGKDRSASRAIKGVGNSAGLLQRQFMRLGGVIAGVFALRQVVTFGKVAVQEFAAAEDAQNRLTDAFARFPRIADLNIQALRDLNTQLQNKTRFDDEAFAAAQAQLAQYSLTGTQIEKLTPLLADFAAKTGQDLPTAAGVLGKALLGQGRGLKAIGVNFKDAGSVTENYAQLIDILTDKVGGFAEKEGQTFSGQLEILGNQFGELKEKIGGVFAPALGHLATIMGEQVLPLFDRLVDVVGPKLETMFSGGAAKLADFFEAFTESVNTGDWGPLTDFFKKAAPLLPTLADGFLKIATALTEEGAVDALSTLATEVLPPLVDLLVAITPLIPPLAALISGVLVPAIGSVSGQISGWTAVFSGNREEMRKWYFNMLGMKGPIGDLFRGVANVAINAMNGIIGALNALAGGLESLVNALSGLTGIRIKLRRIPQVSLAGLLSTGNFTAPKGTQRVAGFGSFAEGGIVPATPGGMFAQIGEGRHDEAVIPLSPRVLSQLGGGGGGDTYNIYVPKGTVMDDDKLAQKIVRLTQNAKSRGAIPGNAFS